MKTLLEFASPKLIIELLIKERAKCCAKNRLRGSTGSFQEQLKSGGPLSMRQQLSAIMPPRYKWARPRYRRKLKKLDGQNDKRKTNILALKQTYQRDLARYKEAQCDLARVPELAYLERLNDFVSGIRNEISTCNIVPFKEPLLKPLFKKAETNAQRGLTLTYRPLSIYTELHDKIILAVTSRYLASMFNWYLHENILSYRSARSFHGKKHHVTDFNDGIHLIDEYRRLHQGEAIYVSDCDIKKFYDVISHQVVRKCFKRMLCATKNLSAEGHDQVMAVLEVYLNSYNFYDSVLSKSRESGFWKEIRCRRNDHNPDNLYQFGWLSEKQFAAHYGGPEQFEQERHHIGISQGGALSLLIADIVLNDVDLDVINPDDRELLFIRFCDDMVVMHTHQEKCQDIMDRYCQSLTRHHLFYHDFTHVSDTKNAEYIQPGFWDIKSHHPFLWGDGEGDSSRWIGFLGYEMNREGSVRLRSSNIEKIKVKILRTYYEAVRLVSQGKYSDLDLFTHKQNLLVKSLSFYTQLHANPELTRQLDWLEFYRTLQMRRLRCKVKSLLSNEPPICLLRFRSFLTGLCSHTNGAPSFKALILHSGEEME